MRTFFLPCLTVQRRACPNSKLGQQQHRSVHLPLTGINPAGGPVPQTNVVIQRKGPMLMWARGPDGSAFTRTQKAYAQDTKQQEAHVFKVMFLQVQKRQQLHSMTLLSGPECPSMQLLNPEI